ncbi:FMR1-interacting protein NUFIP1 [Armigeres subalbatus]|uniref:FMR1-interacting protein NUFIP1 n=1 Tax=Armigeres subalbatus TaxID=124917 RepID=UPI002ED3A025
MAGNENTENTESFRLPAPSFKAVTKKSIDSFTKLRNPHFSTPSGMLLPREKQPPPMYGPRGATVPPWLVTRANQHHPPGYGKNVAQQSQQRFRGPARRNFNSGFDKDVIPELLKVNWDFWCEGCDVNCRSEEELQKHLRGHQPCDIEGCKYVGHPRVMKKHWRLAHDEQKLQEKAQMETKQSPQDIEKWRMERRMRYPSKANVLLRMQEQEERFKRGERIEENKDRFPNKKLREPNKNNQKQSRNRRNHQHKPKKNKPVVEMVANGTDSDDEIESRVRFKGTSEMKNYKKKQANALSLLCGYGTDSDESSAESDTKSIPDNTNTPEHPPNELEETTSVEKIVSSNQYLSEGEILDSDSDQQIATDETQSLKPESSTAINENIEQSKSLDDESKTRKRTRTHRKRNGASVEDASAQVITAKLPRTDKPLLDYSKLRHARQNTLLEKLLEPDIRHERNVLLQCVRFVVQNKFFGIGQPKTDDKIDK